MKRKSLADARLAENALQFIPLQLQGVTPEVTVDLPGGLVLHIPTDPMTLQPVLQVLIQLGATVGVRSEGSFGADPESSGISMVLPPLSARDELRRHSETGEKMRRHALSLLKLSSDPPKSRLRGLQLEKNRAGSTSVYVVLGTEL